jgi:hypothetical protein
MKEQSIMKEQSSIIRVGSMKEQGIHIEFVSIHIGTTEAEIIIMTTEIKIKSKFTSIPSRNH